MNKLYILTSTLFCILLDSSPALAKQNSTCPGLSEQLPPSWNRGVVTSALIGAVPSVRIDKDGEEVALKVGAISHPTLPDINIVWAWHFARKFDGQYFSPVFSQLYIGLLRGSAATAIEPGQWVVEPLRKLSLTPIEDFDGLCQFDFAPYNLGTLGRAFGLRTQTNIMYAGGGATQRNILLFAQNNGKLIKILETPMEYSGLFVGAWRKNSRDHYEEKQNAIFRVVDQKPVAGLEKVLLGKHKKRQHFTWNSVKLMYETTDQNIVRNDLGR